MFLHDCAIAIWSLKGLIVKSPHLSILVAFLHQKNSITLQRMQMFSILSQTIAIELAISGLPPLQDTPPITTTDLLHVVSFWHGKILLTYYMRLIFDMKRFWHLVWIDLTSYNFSLFLFLFLCTFSKSMVCSFIRFCRVSPLLNSGTTLCFIEE